MSRSEVVDKESKRAEQEAKLERMLLEGLKSSSSPWTKEDMAKIKERGLLRLTENGRSEERPQPIKPTNEKDN